MTTSTNTLVVRSVAFWSGRVPDWALLRSVCRGQALPLDEPQRLPPSTLLSAAERRRAPESVQLALHVADRAVKDAALDASTLASVFASPHGDLGITHAMCETLARDPGAVSPTRFIHSVHNAVSGHWGIAQRVLRPSTSVAAGRCTFAAGLLEAATQAACNAEPVLLVAYETRPVGATARLTGTEGSMAVAVVLEPRAMPSQDASAFMAKRESAASGPVMRWHVAQTVASQSGGTCISPQTLGHLARNHLVDALAWLQALATTHATPAPVLALPLSAALHGGASLHIEWEG